MRKSRSQAKEKLIQLKINCAQKVNGCFVFISASQCDCYLYDIPALIVIQNKVN